MSSKAWASMRRLLAALSVAALVVVCQVDPAASQSRTPLSAVKPSEIAPEVRDYTGDTVASHPRLLMTSATRADLISKATTDPYSKTTYAAVKYRADRAVRQSTLADPGSGADRLTTITAELLDRTTALSLVYLVSKDSAYAERLWNDLDAVTKFRDWDPDLFLSTAGITLSVSLAYDWLYDYWSPSRRTQLTDAIERLGLQPSLSYYAEAEPAPGNWSAGTDNWNLVSNAGMIVGALAVADTDEALANRVLAYALPSIRNGIRTLAGGGGYPEGPGYWDYAMGYLTKAVMALRTATGGDYGLSAMDGMAETGLFPIYLTGPAGTVFNFGDSDASVVRPPSLLAFDQLYDSAVLKHAATRANASGNPALRLLWYDPQRSALDPQSAALPLDRRFDNAGVATHRGSWSDPLATGIAIRTGIFGSGGHEDLDAGTFLLDALGENWSVEYGRDTYSLPGYFDRSQDGDRWSYLRKRADGQNTLVVNPYSAQPTTVDARATIERSQSNSDSAMTVVDLTSRYPDDVVSWKRGFLLFNGRREVILQDELRVDRPVEAIWSMHTRADIAISSDGHTATLTQGGRTLVARITSDPDLRFVNLPAEPLPNTSPADSQSPNVGARRLAIQLTANPTTVVTVQFTPRESASPITATRDVTSVSDWSLDPVGASRAAAIHLGGVPLSGFHPDVHTYHTTADPHAIPSLAATAASGATVHASMPDSIPGVATVTVAEVAKSATTYRIFLEKGPSDVSSVSAELTKQGTPELTIDGDPTTYWSTWGDKSITWTLKRSIPFKGISIDWRANSSRRTVYQLQTSPDGSTWTTVYDGAFEGASATQDIVLSSTRTAKFVRLVGHGDGVDDRATVINDVRIYTYDMRTATAPSAPVGLQSVTLSGIPTSLVVSQTQDATVAARLSDGRTPDLSQAKITFRTSDSAVATVDAAGVVTAVGPGSTVVWVQVEEGGIGAYASASVTVSDPTRVRLYPTSDSYVESGSQSSRNFGAATLLMVKPPPLANPDAAYIRYTYMKFDISSLAGGEIVQATLGFNAYLTEGTRARLDIHTATGPWSESTVTWTNRPKLGSTIGSTAVDRAASERHADITQYLHESVSSGRASASLGIAQDSLIDGTTGPRAVISSRNSTMRPYLDVVVMPKALGVSSASAYHSTAGAPSDTIDGKPATYWSTSGDRSITWTLAKAAPVKSVILDWRANATRLVTFEVQTSASGGSWVTQQEGAYDGPSGSQTLVLRSAPKSKYVRLIVHGAGPSDPISSMSEIRFFDYDRSRPVPESAPRYIGGVALSGLPPAMRIGDNATLTTAVTDTTGAPLSADGVSIGYSSSNPAVLSVSSGGGATAHSEGTARVTVTASYNSFTVSDAVEVTVSDPTKVKIYASADSYVEGGGQAGVNFGSAKTMLVKAVSPEPATGAYVRVAYLEFDLSTVAGAEIASASLALSGAVIDASTARMRVDVHSVLGDWTETGITWTNRPAMGDSVGSLVMDRTTEYREVDVTALVRDSATGIAPTMSVGLAQDSAFDGTIGLRTQFFTRESVSQPYIEVVFATGG